MTFTFFQAIVFGIVQGITELFPISSLGHSVLLPKLLGWQINQQDPFFLTFLVATHAATAIVLFLFFWRDWKLVILGMIRSLRAREIKESDTYAKLAWLLVVGTIPAGLLGVLFEETFKKFFSAPQLVAVILFFNGLMLFVAEIFRRRRLKEVVAGGDVRIAKLKWLDSLTVGVFQCLALFPGFSRTGSAMTGGLMMGLSHEDAARFSFLLATPIIGAAAFLKLPELSAETSVVPQILVGAVFAGLFAFLSVRFLLKYFQTKTLTPFAIYCSAAGVIFSLIFLFF